MVVKTQPLPPYVDCAMGLTPIATMASGKTKDSGDGQSYSDPQLQGEEESVPSLRPYFIEGF